MSEWTHVRILYDVDLRMPEKNCKILTSENGLGYMGITQLYHTAMEEMRYSSRENILKLGSEGPVKLNLQVEYGCSTWCGDQRIEVDDRGTLTIIGDLRDCNKFEFIEKLNEFREHLKNYGIFVVEGLVRIT